MAKFLRPARAHQCRARSGVRVIGLRLQASRVDRNRHGLISEAGFSGQRTSPVQPSPLEGSRHHHGDKGAIRLPMRLHCFRQGVVCHRRPISGASPGITISTLEPLIPAGSIVQIDTRRREISPRKEWARELQRPIYFLKTADAYFCGWCEVDPLGGINPSAPTPFTCLQPEMEIPERNRNDRPRCRRHDPIHAESMIVHSNFYLGKLPESAL